jgi:hypothetical protein
MRKIVLLAFILISITLPVISFSGSRFYLDFSDGAKYSDVARNIVQGKGFGTSFSFFRETNMEATESGIFSARWISPGMPYTISLLFKLFGISDVAAISTSLFYFSFGLVFLYLLSRKILNNFMVAIISGSVVLLNTDYLYYAVSAGSESMFFFEVSAAFALIAMKKRWADIASIFLVIAMYLTRPQAIIYIVGVLIFYFFLNYKTKKAVLFSLGSTVLASFLYLIFSQQGSIAITQNLPGSAVSDSLRGGMVSAGVLTLAKKVFYNLYNFYKLLPDIMNPYLFALFVIGIFSWGKDRLFNSFKIASLFMVLATFLVTALTIPFFRYIHPIVPFVYLIAVATLFQIVSGIPVPSLVKISHKNFAILLTAFLIFVFAIGQTLGVIFLDSRFEKRIYNQGKPPIYVAMSHSLKEKTEHSQVIVTNLDTWGSWYGERKTVWFPLEPKQIINNDTGDIPFDGIYLTSYLMDDENYYMGEGWRQIFLNPGEPDKWTCEGCEVIAEKYYLQSVIQFNSSEVYEKIDGRAVLLLKK